MRASPFGSIYAGPAKRLARSGASRGKAHPQGASTMPVCRLAVSLLLLIAVPGSFGAPRGRVAGTVRDPSGAVVAHARVTLSAPEFHTATETDDRGRYSLTGVPAGTIELSAEAAGFAAGRFSGELRASVPLTVNFRFGSIEG